MKFVLYVCCLIGLLFSFGCRYHIDKTAGASADSGGTPGGQGLGGSLTNQPLTFAVLKARVLTPNRCLKCHTGTGSGILDADFSTYQSTMASVKIKQPQASEIYTDVAQGKMPKGGPSLKTEEIKFIEAWINAGAPQ